MDQTARPSLKTIRLNQPDQVQAALADLLSRPGPTAADLGPGRSEGPALELFNGGEAVYSFDLTRLDVGLLRPLLDRPLVGHDAIPLIKLLLRSGLTGGKIGSTTLQHQALTGRLVSLVQTAEELLGWSPTAGTGRPSAGLFDDQAPAGAPRTAAVFQLDRLLRPRLMERSLGRCYQLMRDAQTATARMELNGVYFDLAAHARLVDRWQGELARAEEELHKTIGPEVNPASGAQLSAWLERNLGRAQLAAWPRSRKSGLLRTNAWVLALFQNIPLVEPLLEYRRLSRLVAAQGQALADQVDPVDQRIHSHFFLGAAPTGRMASADPNMQSIPRSAEVRRLFAAPPGTKLIVADYSQIELRVAAMVSGDRVMDQVYRAGEDLHRSTAAALLGVGFKEVTPEQRQLAKAANFGLLYGQGAKGLARYAESTYGVPMTEAEAEGHRQAFFNTYRDLARWQRRTVGQARKQGRLATPGGRVFDLSRRRLSPPEALNFPIQGGAAEAIMAALTRLDAALADCGAKLVNVVHDEVVVEAAEEAVDQTREAVVRAMIQGVQDIFPKAPLTNLVEADVGPDWAAAK